MVHFRFFGCPGRLGLWRILWLLGNRPTTLVEHHDTSRRQVCNESADDAKIRARAFPCCSMDHDGRGQRNVEQANGQFLVLREKGKSKNEHGSGPPRFQCVDPVFGQIESLI